MKISIRRIGNSQGIIIPKPLISQLDLSAEVDLELEDDKIVLRKPRRKVRSGWAQASKKVASRGATTPLWPLFANRADKTLRW